MKTPEITANEDKRLEQIETYEVLPTFSEEAYDEITKIAARIANTPIALISIVGTDKQCFKSHYGLEDSETDKKYSFCAHTILETEEVMIIPDARDDERFYDNPLVTDYPKIQFYAGFPLITPEGYALGSLCVIDYKPGNLNEDQVNSLKALRNQVVRLFELKKHKRLLTETNQQLEAKNEQLEKFAHRAAHDIKSPLKNISGLVDYLTQTKADSLDEEGLEMLQMITNSSEELTKLVQGILEYSKSEKCLQEDQEEVNLLDFFRELEEIYLNSKGAFNLNLPDDPGLIKINKVALQQIFLNLISNGIKYCDKEKPEISLDFSQDHKFYHFAVKDNGPGIPEEKREQIFQLFETLPNTEEGSSKGSGIGLATVEKLVNGLAGTIQVEENKGAGATFRFSIPK